VSCALQKQLVWDFWLSGGFGGWLSKLLRPNVAPALFEKGVIIPALCAGNTLDKGLFAATRNSLPIDERQAWRALLQAGYLTVVDIKIINDKASLVLKPPNDLVATALRAGIFENFEPVLRLALRHDDLVKVVTTAAKFVERPVYYHFYNTSNVQERDVQKAYSMVWAVLDHKFAAEVPTLDGRVDFIFEGTKNTHVLEFGMVSSGSRKNDSVLKSKIDTALQEKTKQVRDFVCPPRNKKPIRFWVALFSKAKGKLLHVSEVSEV